MLTKNKTKPLAQMSDNYTRSLQKHQFKLMIKNFKKSSNKILEYEHYECRNESRHWKRNDPRERDSNENLPIDALSRFHGSNGNNAANLNGNV